MEEIKVSEMLQADSINKDDSVMIIQEGVNKKASGSIQTATGTSLSLTSVADTCKVTSNSKNMFDGKLELGTYSDVGVPSDSSTNYRNVNKIKVESETTYTFSIDGVSQKYVVYYYNASGTFINSEGLTTGTLTTPANCYYINFRCFVADFVNDYANLKLQLEQGSTATSYNPYNTEVKITDGTNTQSITLTPQEEKYAFTYDDTTTLTSNGSVTIEYNTQSRLLNNDDTTAIIEYVDREAEEIYSTEETKIGTFMGKPLYRKVFVINATIPSNSASSGGTVNIFNKSTYNADEVFIKSCRVDNSDNSVSIYVPYAGGQPRYIGISRISNNINVSFYNAFSNENVKITSIIEYTKTTD